MVKGVRKVGRTTRIYRGLAFSYLPNAKRSLPVRLWLFVNDELQSRSFSNIREAVTFIDSVLDNGGAVRETGNRLIVKVEAVSA